MVESKITTDFEENFERFIHLAEWVDWHMADKPHDWKVHMCGLVVGEHIKQVGIFRRRWEFILPYWIMFRDYVIRQGYGFHIHKRDRKNVDIYLTKTPFNIYYTGPSYSLGE